jgi:hypothetical protein
MSDDFAPRLDIFNACLSLPFLAALLIMVLPNEKTSSHA